MRLLIRYSCLVIFVCALSLVFGCKKREAKQGSPLEGQLPSDATVSVTESDLSESDLESNGQIAIDDLEVISIEVDTSDYLAPTPKQVQQALKNTGYYKGEIDGVIGSGSQSAIKNFQKDNGLSADGKVGPKTWSKLRKYQKSHN